MIFAATDKGKRMIKLFYDKKKEPYVTIEVEKKEDFDFLKDTKLMPPEKVIEELENEIHLVEYVDGLYAENISLELLKSVRDLITRQQAEIEICAEVIKRQDKEIDELNELANERLDKFTEQYDRNLKAEAIKEFVERLGNYKEYRYNENCDFVPYVKLSDIEKVVYEMVGTEK